MSNFRVNEEQNPDSLSSIPSSSRPSRLPTRNSSQKPLAAKSRSGLDSKSLDRRPSANAPSALDPSRLSRQDNSLNRPSVSKIPRQGSSSSVHPSGLTSLGRNVGNKSPRSSSRKDNRPISDRNWQYDQLVKVRNYVTVEFPDMEASSIKSGISLDVFIELTHKLFQLIDSRINITRENYIEEVAVNLKRYRYPAPVKPSFLKTINTPHCWPSVLAIFSWLVDFIKEINRQEEWTDSDHDLAFKAIAESYLLWNSGGDLVSESVIKALEEKLKQKYNVSKEDLIDLDNEIASLIATSEDINLKNVKLVNEIEAVQNNIDVLSHKCDNYVKEKEKLESELTNSVKEYSEKVKALNTELHSISKTEKSLEHLVASQPYSYSDKIKVTEEIKALQNTVVLKEEKVRQQRELQSNYDYELMRLKQELESGAYKYNSIMHELVLLNSDLKSLYIRDTNFGDPTVLKEFEKVDALVKKHIASLTEHDTLIQKEVQIIHKETKQLENQLLLAKKQYEQLSASEMEVQMTGENEVKKLDVETDKFVQKRDSLKVELSLFKKKKIDIINTLQKTVEKEQINLQKLKDFKINLKNEAVIFFKNLSDATHKNLYAYQEQMKRMQDGILSMQKKEIEAKGKVLEQIEKINSGK